MSIESSSSICLISTRWNNLFTSSMRTISHLFVPMKFIDIFPLFFSIFCRAERMPYVPIGNNCSMNLSVTSTTDSVLNLIFCFCSSGMSDMLMNEKYCILFLSGCIGSCYIASDTSGSSSSLGSLLSFSFSCSLALTSASLMGCAGSSSPLLRMKIATFLLFILRISSINSL